MVSLLYQPPAMRWRGVSVLTNTPPRRAQSQPGGMQGITLIEPILAKAARKLGVDQVAIHRINAPEGKAKFGPANPRGERAYATSAFVKEALDRGAELFRWDERKAQGGKRQGSKVRGYGVADERVRRRLDRVRRPVRDQARRPHVHPVRHRQPRHRVDERLPSRRRPRWSACRGRRSSVTWGHTGKNLPWSCVSGGSQTTHAHTRAAHAAATDAHQEAAGDRREGARRQAGAVRGRRTSGCPDRAAA